MVRALQKRNRLLNRVAKILARKGMARLQMSLMVLLTASLGFIASFLMLLFGITCMWLRYPLAVLVAYGVFLSLIWLWLHSYRKGGTGNFDLLDPSDISSGDSDNVPSFNGGGGGEFGGGGASGSFATGISKAGHIPVSSKSSGLFDGLDFPFDSDELALVLVVLGVSLFAIVIGIIMVISAPTFLGEVFIDGALAAGLYHRLKKIERRNWLETAFRRTWLPVVGLILFFAVAGFVFHWYAPNADSIGDIWIHFKSSLRE